MFSAIAKYISNISLVGIGVGFITFAIALQPGILPRKTIWQVLLGSVWFLVGYLVGLLCVWMTYKLLNKKGFIWPAWVRILIQVVAVILMFFVVWLAQYRQSSLAEGLAINFPASSVVSVFIPLVLIIASVIILSSVLKIVLKQSKLRLNNIVGKRYSDLVFFALPILLVAGLYYGSISYLESSQQAKNRVIQNDVMMPQSTFVSGSSESYVKWEDLGLQGRRYVSGVLSKEELARFGKSKPMDPIRVYSSVQNAPTLDERVDLAIQELERTDAFSRSALVLFTPSGTGWINEVAASSFEYIFAGDVASVAMQYGEVSSFLQYALDKNASVDSSIKIFDAIQQKLKEIPEDERPEFYVYGESLGSMGSQAKFVELSDEETNRLIDGAIWVGSPSASALSKKYLNEKQPPNVLFVSDVDRSIDLSSWPSPRIGFLFNTNDPVVRISPAVAAFPPGWLQGDRENGVNPSTVWIPGITISQLATELLPAQSFGPGIGHSYVRDIPIFINSVVDGDKILKDDLDKLVEFANEKN